MASQISTVRGKLRLAILDPGLMESAGHHAGFATTISSSYHRYKSDFEVIYFANEKLDRGLEARLGVSGIAVERFFCSQFYEYFEQSGNVVVRNEYVNNLSLEYLKVFQYLGKYWCAQGGVLLYHTLSWEPAIALQLAIELHGREGRALEHRILLMFSPGTNEEGEVYDVQKSLNYRSALRRLSSFENVLLFASCWDYAKAYQKLLDYDEILPIHPCFLADWESAKYWDANVSIGDQCNPNIDSANVLMYLGDAKSEKGFLRLPELLKEWLGIVGEDTILSVYYTSNWPSFDVNAVVNELKKLALKDRRVQVYDKFLSEHELHQLFQKVDLCVLSYEESAYQYKTSGILWLLGFYQIPLVYYGGTSWVSRESWRLLSRYVVLSGNSLPTKLSYQELDFSNSEGVALGEGYRSKLYDSFWNWLDSTYE